MGADLSSNEGTSLSECELVPRAMQGGWYMVDNMLLVC